jgi:hypothetical protein
VAYTFVGVLARLASWVKSFTGPGTSGCGLRKREHLGAVMIDDCELQGCRKQAYAVVELQAYAVVELTA